ncbi:hypothetical protein RB595_001125 [Gaeumannomyces hyphopodioides]
MQTDKSQKTPTRTSVAVALGEDSSTVLAEYGLATKQDGTVCWKPDSPDHPRNWSTARKTFDTTIIILLEFYTTVISTTGASVADRAAAEYGFGPRQSLIAFTFMYQLGQAIGGCVIPPFSEIVGRRWPYLASCAAFSLFCLVVTAGGGGGGGAVHVGRFVTGLASAAPSVVVAGSVEDMFNARRRVWVVVLWNAGTTAGLCLGPVYAAHVSAAAGWRWVFRSAAAATAVLFVALLWVRESRPSILLGRKIRRLEKERGVRNLRWSNPDSTPDSRALLEAVVVRPVRILLTEPLVIMVAVISAVSWGIIYLFAECLLGIYMTMGLGETQASLPFLAIAVGVLFTFLPRLWDMSVVKARRRRGEHIEPEDKIMGFTIAAPALTVGLAWFSWTIPPLVQGLHWAAPTAALVLVGFAVNELAYTLSAYLSDAYLLYSASAFAGLAFVRAIVSGLMPLVAHELYGPRGPGANVAGSILAAVSALFCVAPWVFIRFSRRLRQRSPFACYSLETHRRIQVEED